MAHGCDDIVEMEAQGDERRPAETGGGPGICLPAGWLAGSLPLSWFDLSAEIHTMIYFSFELPSFLPSFLATSSSSLPTTFTTSSSLTHSYHNVCPRIMIQSEGNEDGDPCASAG